MGRGASGEASAWSMELVKAVTSLRDAAGLTNQELIERTGMSTSYYYARLRGDAPFDTNDIEKLAAALNIHPHEVSRVAAANAAAAEEMEPKVTVDPAELGRRLTRLASSPRGSGVDFSVDELVDEMAERGIAFAAGEWKQLARGKAGDSVHTRVLESIASYAEVPGAYLLDLSDVEAADAAEAQLEFRSAVRVSGAGTVSARAVGDVSPAALRAIAASLRSIRRE